MNNKTIVIGLVNGMIGGIILVLPILAIKTGWLLIAPLTIISGFFSYFSCLLCLRHLRDYHDLDVAIYHHFGKKRSFKIFYDVIIILSMTTLLILYFSLICQQWAGIVGTSKIIPILNALVLFPIVYILKKFDFGAQLLAYGIFSIIGYIMFLIGISFTTEPGPNQIPAVHSDFVDLVAALAQGFAIQTFFIPILKKNKNRNSYKKLLRITYVIGTLIYCFIGYSGANSFVNRKHQNDPQTIIDYFGSGENWAVVIVEIIYLVHLYSAFPEFLLIAKQRFFSIFQWPQPKDVTLKEILYVAVTIFLSLIVKLTEMRVTVIIELNGSIISFFFIYLIPIGLHLKCLYFTKQTQRHSMLNEEKNQNQIQEIQSEQKKQKNQLQQKKQVQISNNSQKQPKVEIQMKEISNKVQTYLSQKLIYRAQNKQNLQIIQSNKCQCDIKFKSKFHQYAQLVLMFTMVSVGLFTMIYTIYLLINQE